MIIWSANQTLPEDIFLLVTKIDYEGICYFNIFVPPLYYPATYFGPCIMHKKTLNYYKTALKYPIGIWIQKQKSTQNVVLKTAQIPFFEVWNWVVGVERMLKKKSEYQLCIFSSRIMIFDARSKATIKYYVICHLQTK